MINNRKLWHKIVFSQITFNEFVITYVWHPRSSLLIYVYGDYALIIIKEIKLYSSVIIVIQFFRWNKEVKCTHFLGNWIFFRNIYEFCEKKNPLKSHHPKEKKIGDKTHQVKTKYSTHQFAHKQLNWRNNNHIKQLLISIFKLKCVTTNLEIGMRTRCTRAQNRILSSSRIVLLWIECRS